VTKLETVVLPVAPRLLEPDTRDDPWVADLRGSSADGDCQSTVGFEDRTCEGEAHWYAELEAHMDGVANPRWEGKLCHSCLAGWREWAAEEPLAVRIVSVHPIVRGE
jgi:hypothetical protein